MKTHLATNPTITEQLSGHRLGRLVLHVICLVRRPENARWHCRGILREVVGRTL